MERKSLYYHKGKVNTGKLFTSGSDQHNRRLLFLLSVLSFLVIPPTVSCVIGMAELSTYSLPCRDVSYKLDLGTIMDLQIKAQRISLGLTLGSIQTLGCTKSTRAPE